ncbi:MAG: hypothetical protein AB8B64_05710 [Granulosicoccus sp.]
MSIFSKIVTIIRRALEYRGRAHAHQQMLRMSDRQLADFGYSRVLLLEGVSAWPWRVQDDTEQANDLRAMVSTKPEKTEKVNKPTAREIRQAVKELSTYTDRELTEMGISRGSIREIVRSGRPSFEGVDKQNKRAA